GIAILHAVARREPRSAARRRLSFPPAHRIHLSDNRSRSMAIPPPNKRPQSPAPAASSDAGDLLQILVFRKTLTREQAERVRRQTRGTTTPVVQAIVKLGLATEAQVGEALAAFAGLRFVKINPLELDLDVVTGALSGPFVRKHGIVAIAKTDEKLTVAVHDPFAPFPADDIKRVTGLLAIDTV